LSLRLHDELRLRLELGRTRRELLCLNLHRGICLAVLLCRLTGLLGDSDELEELLLLRLELELGELLLLQLLNYARFVLGLDVRLRLLPRSSMRVGLAVLLLSAEMHHRPCKPTKLTEA
jgi:hypothetical protein